MYNLDQVVKGLATYLDNEILAKVNGWQKWVYGAGMGIVLNKSVNIFNNLKQNKMVKTLDIINDEDMINIDLLYENFKKEADKGAITFEIPGLGALTLTNQDVDKLYNYIRN